MVQLYAWGKPSQKDSTYFFVTPLHFQVTKLAFAQVNKYGMNDVIGPLSFADRGGDDREMAFVKKPYSKKLQALMDHVSL